jgi:bacillithiol biosynthesis deacetylase BshB1
MNSNRTILVFSPHPDDAEIAMGGTMALLLQQGWQVILIDLTNGEPTPAGSETIRAVECDQATRILGLTERRCLGLPNRYLQETLQARRLLAEVIREYRPHWVFTCRKPDAHPDHIHTTGLVDDARFAAKLTRTDMAFTPHDVQKIMYFYGSHLRIHPEASFALDVTPVWDQKIQAISAYQSQFWHNQTDPGKKGWIIDYVTTFCRYFGSRIGVKYAEPFFCHELVGMSSLAGLL